MLGKLLLAAASTSIEVKEIDIPTGLLYAALGICVVFVALLAIMCVIKIMGAISDSANKKTDEPAKAAPAPTPAPVAAPTPAPAPVAAPVAAPAAPAAAASAAASDHPEGFGEYTLPVKHAAMIMAIVADEMGCEPNELSFKSIKRISEHPVVDGCELVNVPDEKTAAMVMAVVADAMGCQPAELCFHSIKRV